MKKVAKIALIFISLMILGVVCIIPVKAQPQSTQYFINADGNLTPSTTLINISGNTYSLSGDINGSIEVDKSGITIEGNGYSLKGSNGMGIWLKAVNSITIKDLTVEGFFQSALYLTSSSDNNIYNDSFSSNDYCGINLIDSSNDNNIYDNNVTNNIFAGIVLSCSSPIPSEGSGCNQNKIFLNNSLNSFYCCSSLCYC